MANETGSNNNSVDKVVAPSARITLPSPWRDARVTVVTPTYNEADNLPKLVDALMALPLPNLQLLVVDDNSPDGTGELAEKLSQEFSNAAGTPRIHVLHRTAKNGLGRAYLAGMQHALDNGAEFIVQMDADLSHPPECVPQMLGVALATGAGAVVGSRYVPGGRLEADWGLHRKLLSGWANFYVNTILNMRMRDVTAGFKLWNAQTLRELDLETIHSNGYSFQVEMAYRALLHQQKIIEIPIHFKERVHGESKMDFGVMFESAKMPFKLWYQQRDERAQLRSSRKPNQSAQ